tara:strand:- start:153 stop:818 length:666 start_codon:yes stop_codon:yes gene_type:complete
MPVEPNTGKQLPYKGEPGYEQAKAQYPDLYAAEEQGMAPEEAPPADMQPADMQPADMPGDEGPADAMGQQDELMQMAESAPMPEKPFSVSAVKTLLKELNKALDAFSGQDIPDLEVEMPSKGAKLEGPLPPGIYLTLLAIAESLTLLDPKSAEKYQFNPQEIVTDADLRKVTATLKKMSKDKKVLEAMQAPAGGEAEMEMEQPSAPGFFDEDEQTLAANMS